MINFIQVKSEWKKAQQQRFSKRINTNIPINENTWNHLWSTQFIKGKISFCTFFKLNIYNLIKTIATDDIRFLVHYYNTTTTILACQCPVHYRSAKSKNTDSTVRSGCHGSALAMHYCYICDKGFVLNWRLGKHMKMHSEKDLCHCYYFRNNHKCPFAEIGCKFLHKEATI